MSMASFVACRTIGGPERTPSSFASRSLWKAECDQTERGIRSAGPRLSSSRNPRHLFFDNTQVSASFSKGAVLLDGTNRNYMVHTSRRDQPGQAEVHALDTDIIYVMQGTATFVTGGTAVN